MRIAVIGAGGVGGYFGGRLAQSGADVHFLARGRHLEAMQADGLEIRSRFGDATVPVQAHGSATEIGPCDTVLFCVKSYDTESAGAHLPHLMHEDTAVVSLQNGVDNQQKLAAVVGRDHILGGLALIFAILEEPGVVTHSGGPARVLFGELDGSGSERSAVLLRAFHSAGVDAVESPTIVTAMWKKYAFLCALAGLTAGTRLPLGEVRDCPVTWDLFRSVVEEVFAVARAEGVVVAEDAVEERVQFAAGVEGQSYSSLHHDLVSGNRMELEALHGMVVRLGDQHGVPTPACRAIYALLQPHAAAAERG